MVGDFSVGAGDGYPGRKEGAVSVKRVNPMAVFLGFEKGPVRRSIVGGEPEFASPVAPGFVRAKLVEALDAEIAQLEQESEPETVVEKVVKKVRRSKGGKK